MYDVLIIWWWVSGTALLYTLSKFTNIKNIALLEKYDNFGLVNSKATNNSQTLHCGDIETNYTLEKARKVQRKAYMLKHFLEDYKVRYPHSRLFSRYNKMVLAVWATQVQELEQRYKEFKTLFPNFHRIEREEIAKLEPKVMEGRNPKEQVLALTSDEGYTIDYGLLSQAFVAETQKYKHDNQTIDIFLNTKVEEITKIDSGYKIITKDWKEFTTKVLAVCAGWHTPLIAQSLGYAQDFSILSVAGTFFKSSEKLLNGKVYTLQVPELPFAAIHGDPDVHNQNETRFGPTAKGIFMLERYDYTSVWDYFQVFGFKPKAFIMIAKLMVDKIVWPYLFINFLYDLPWIGKRLFLREIKKIIPTVTTDQILIGDKLGGTRPQILNLKTMQLEMGEAKLQWDNAVFNITPSPGATTCLSNAFDDTQTIIWFLGDQYHFDKEEFEKLYVNS
jgi:malate dehydrogenase (quinone)